MTTIICGGRLHTYTVHVLGNPLFCIQDYLLYALCDCSFIRFLLLGGSLLLMAMLGLIVLFIYAVVSFAFLHTSFTTDNDDILYCGNLGECFVSVIRYGLIGGSLGLVSV